MIEIDPSLIPQRISFYQVDDQLNFFYSHFSLSIDLLSATEDLIDFSINVFDTIRLQSHFNDRNRRTSLGMQLKDVMDTQKNDFGFVDVPTKPCTVTTTLKYDLSLYLDRILQACKRTKVNSIGMDRLKRMGSSFTGQFDVITCFTLTFDEYNTFTRRFDECSSGTIE